MIRSYEYSSIGPCEYEYSKVFLKAVLLHRRQFAVLVIQYFVIFYLLNKRLFCDELSREAIHFGRKNFTRVKTGHCWERSNYCQTISSPRNRKNLELGVSKRLEFFTTSVTSKTKFWMLLSRKALEQSMSKRRLQWTKALED